MSENIELAQISDNRFVVAFSKNALAGLKEGKASAITVKGKGKNLKFVFMRDSVFHEKMAEFQKAVATEFRNFPFWKRWWVKMFSKRNPLSLHKSPNMTTKTVT